MNHCYSRYRLQGSALIALIMFIFIISLYMVIMWKRTCYIYDFAYVTEKNTQKYYSSYAFMRWVIALIRSNQEFINATIQRDKKFIVTHNKWPLNDKEYIHATAQVTQKNKQTFDVHSFFREQSKNDTWETTCAFVLTVTDSENKL